MHVWRARQISGARQRNMPTPILLLTMFYFTVAPGAVGMALNRGPECASAKEGKSNTEKGPLRVNRALRATHSRRATDRFIQEGRLLVNGEVVVSSDLRLQAGDKVCPRLTIHAGRFTLPPKSKCTP